MWQFFKLTSFPSHCLSWTPLNPNLTFTQTPSFSSKILCKITSRYVFLNIVFTFVLNFADFSLGFQKLGIFRKWVGFLNFVKFFPNLWLGWVPIDMFVSMLAPWGILIMYWGKLHHVHALFIKVVHCYMLGAWQNVLVTFLCWIGLKWVPILGFPFDWTCWTCFDQWECVLHTLTILCLKCHALHHLGTH